MKLSLLLAQKHTFSKKVLRQRSGVSLAIISTTTSQATAVGTRLFIFFMKNTGTGVPIEVLKNKAFQQNWRRQAILGARVRTRFPTSRWSAALMTVVCTAQTPSNYNYPRKITLNLMNDLTKRQKIWKTHQHWTSMLFPLFCLVFLARGCRNWFSKKILYS